LFRDLTIEGIYSLIDKFPEQTKREMVAIITTKYLKEFSRNDN